jgi:hypothetical protein
MAQEKPGRMFKKAVVSLARPRRAETRLSTGATAGGPLRNVRTKLEAIFNILLMENSHV